MALTGRTFSLLANLFRNNYSNPSFASRILFHRTLFLGTKKGSQEGGNVQNLAEVQDFSVEKAVDVVEKKYLNLKEKFDTLYVGIGQYYSDPTKERVVVLSCTFNQSSDIKLPFEPLLDCSLETNCVDILLQNLENLKTNIAYGEINAVDKGRWNHGFTIQPDFRIFTKESLVCNFGEGKLLFKSRGVLEEIPLNGIKSVNVHLSDEPWNSQGIDLQLKNGTYTSIVHFEIENDKRDLAMLMMDTEWTVKTAALLCLKIKKLGHKVDLKLPKYLTIQGNPWVDNRQNTWTRLMLSANSES